MTYTHTALPRSCGYMTDCASKPRLTLFELRRACALILTLDDHKTFQMFSSHQMTFGFVPAYRTTPTQRVSAAKQTRSASSAVRGADGRNRDQRLSSFSGAGHSGARCSEVPHEAFPSVQNQPRTFFGKCGSHVRAL